MSGKPNMFYAIVFSIIFRPTHQSKKKEKKKSISLNALQILSIMTFYQDACLLLL